jgi:hypothetical protein
MKESHIRFKAFQSQLRDCLDSRKHVMVVEKSTSTTAPARARTRPPFRRHTGWHHTAYQVHTAQYGRASFFKKGTIIIVGMLPIKNNSPALRQHNFGADAALMHEKFSDGTSGPKEQKERRRVGSIFFLCSPKILPPSLIYRLCYFLSLRHHHDLYRCVVLKDRGRLQFSSLVA